jgi:hypothetical protein
MLARFTSRLHGPWSLTVTHIIFATCHAGVVAIHEFRVVAAVFSTLAGSFLHTLTATLHAFRHTFGITMLTSIASRAHIFVQILAACVGPSLEPLFNDVVNPVARDTSLQQGFPNCPSEEWQL